MLHFKVDHLLSRMLQAGRNVSDLNLSTGRPPQVEIDGKLTPVEIRGLPMLKPFHTEAIAMALMGGRKKHLDDLGERGSVDLSYAIPGVTRFRVNIFFQRGTLAAVLRVIPQSRPDSRSVESPQGVAQRRQAQEWHRAGHRPDGLGQVDDPRRHHPRDQPSTGDPHRHHRRPDRVPPPQPRSDGQSA